MYIIKRNNIGHKIVYMEYDDIKYPIKNDYLDGIHVDTIYLYNKNYINTDESNDFENIFNNLTGIIFNYLYNNEDDDDDGTIDLLIGETDRIKNELESKYKEFMKREDYYAYVDKLSFLHEELLNKKEIIKYKKNINNIITGKSR
ncbi:MAG: hypothetical protein K6C11_02800 [Bacilli bacterium]|nr:hypothetical protein [Bacilli bacterium]